MKIKKLVDAFCNSTGAFYKYTSTICKTIAFVSVLFCVGCATAPDAPERSEGSVQTEPEQEEKEETPVKDSPAHAPVVAREIEAQEPELEAVKYLLDQAESALEIGDVERAGALLDRVLLIDRKSSRAYLVLARTLFAEKKPGQARAIAQQGLLYTSRHTAIGQQLEKLTQSN